MSYFGYVVKATNENKFIGVYEEIKFPKNFQKYFPCDLKEINELNQNH